MFRSKDRLYTNTGRNGTSVETAARPSRQRSVQVAGRSNEEVANGGGFQSPFGGKSGMSMSAMGGGTAKSLDTYLLGFADERNAVQLRHYYKDIYENDCIGGSAVDLTSSLPFSDFDLTGADDKDLEVYKEACDRLNIVNLMPIITAEYLVNGAYVGQLIYDERSKNFRDILPYGLNDLTFEDMPFFSLDPTITVRVGQSIQDFLSSDSPFIEKYRRTLPANLLAAMHDGEYELDPLSTLYVPRATFSDGNRISYFRRLLPIYLFEKALYRGTVVEAYKRLRSLLHIQAGDEYWEATAEELSVLVGAFQRAELDPIGAIVATRNGINVQEVRQGGDFWKWTDINDSLTSIKLKALGQSEAFLSGEASYNNSETALSVYIESLRTLRTNFTYRIFYNRIFPTIAAVHGKFKDKKAEEMHKRQQDRNASDAVNNNSKYLIPEIRWHKSLAPFADRDTLDMLDEMTQKGLPPQIRTLAAAGGINFEAYLKGMNEDLELRKKIKSYQDQVAKMSGAEGYDDGGDEGEDGIGGAEDSLDSLAEQLATFRPSVSKAMNRNFQGDSEIVGSTKTGKRKYMHNQAKAQRDHNERLVKQLSNLSDPNVMARQLKLAQRLGVKTLF